MHQVINRGARPVWAALLAGCAALACLAGAAPGVAQGSAPSREYADYTPPGVMLAHPSGRMIPLAGLLQGPKPVVLEFFYTTCTTICGMQSSTLALAQAQLGKDVTLVSISIDPEYDTPARLREYGKNFNPAANWYMLTGRRDDIMRVLTAFDARPLGDNKMLHRPYVYIHAAPGRKWLRLEGMVDARQIVAEVRAAKASPPPPSETASGLFSRILGG